MRSSTAGISARSWSSAAFRAQHRSPSAPKAVGWAQAAAGDIIITPKLDRMFRSAVDALNVLQELKDRGISLHMIDLGGDVTGNGVSKLVFTILSAVAEAERDRIRERIRDVKRDQRRRGKFLGGTRPPFGYSTMRDGDRWSSSRTKPSARRCARCRRYAPAAGASARSPRRCTTNSASTSSPASSSGSSTARRPRWPANEPTSQFIRLMTKSRLSSRA